jgi:hypothetical protein
MNRKLAGIAARFFPLFLVAAGAVQAAPGAPLGAAFPIASNVLTRPAVARSAGGNFVVVYYAGPNGAASLMAQRVNADGTLNGGPILVAAGSTGNWDFNVATDSAGDFVVAWDTFINDQTGIMARRFAADGSAQGAAFAVAQGSKLAFLSEVSLPAVAMSPDGRFVVTWLQQGGIALDQLEFLCLGGVELATGESSILFKAYGSDGNASTLSTVAVSKAGVSIGANLLCGVEAFLSLSQLDQGGEPSLSQSAVAMGSAGDFTLAWSMQNESGAAIAVIPYGNYSLGVAPTRITVQHYSALGLPTDLPQVVQGMTPQPSALEVMLNPRIAEGAAGVALAWNYSDFDVDASKLTLSINDRGYSSALQPLGAAATTASGEELFNQDFLPQIAATPAGSVVTWRATQQSGSAAPQQISAQLLSSAGAAQGGPIEVAASADSNSADVLYAPAIASDSNGDFVVVWTDFSSHAAATATIYGRLYSGQ